MHACYCSATTKPVIPLNLIALDSYSSWLKQQDSFTQRWLTSQKLTPKAGQFCLIPALTGELAQVIAWFTEDQPVHERLGGLPYRLPGGDYALNLKKPDPLLFLGWGMGAYEFALYKKSNRPAARLAYTLADNEIADLLTSIYLARDLINLPADALGPGELAQNARKLAARYKAKYQEIVGEELLQYNFPAIYAVGRASAQAPRLIHLQWGKKTHPKIALIGKGVCFDTGGLDLKGSSNMRLMKKDMGGAAHVLALANLIMAQKLPLQLDLYIPAVENALSGSALHPGDVLIMRNGKTVEIDNTDAEGRLILADTITYALEKTPQLLIDFATLTGAARVALGTDIAAYFCNNQELIPQLERCAAQTNEPIWQLPLYKPYFRDCKSYLADFKNSGGAYGGAITAALFLQQFVTADIPWVHFDVLAWNMSSRAAHPEGGEVMGLHTAYLYLKQLVRK